MLWARTLKKLENLAGELPASPREGHSHFTYVAFSFFFLNTQKYLLPAGDTAPGHKHQSTLIKQTAAAPTLPTCKRGEIQDDGKTPELLSSPSASYLRYSRLLPRGEERHPLTAAGSTSSGLEASRHRTTFSAHEKPRGDTPPGDGRSETESGAGRGAGSRAGPGRAGRSVRRVPGAEGAPELGGGLALGFSPRKPVAARSIPQSCL